MQQPDPELAELGQRLHHLAGDQVKATRARHKVKLALDPHAANAIRRLADTSGSLRGDCGPHGSAGRRSRDGSGKLDRASTGLAVEVAKSPVVADLRSVRLRLSECCLRPRDQGLKLATPRPQLVTLRLRGGRASSIFGRLVSRATLSASSDMRSEL